MRSRIARTERGRRVRGVREHVGSTVVHDGDRIRYASEGFLDMVGADTRSNVLEKSLSTYLDPSSAERLRTQFDRLRRGDASALGARVTVRTAADTTRDAVAMSSRVAWDDEDRLQTTFVDFDDAPSALTLTGRAMDEAPIGVTIADATGDDLPLAYVNDEFLELTGYPREAVIGRNCRFLQGEHTRQEPVARMRAAIDAAEPVTVVLRNYRKDGSMFWNRVTIVPIEDDAGRVTHFLGYQEDVTETKLREHEKTLFETHAEATDQAMFIADTARKPTRSRVGGSAYAQSHNPPTTAGPTPQRT